MESLQASQEKNAQMQKLLWATTLAMKDEREWQRNKEQIGDDIRNCGGKVKSLDIDAFGLA